MNLKSSVGEIVLQQERAPTCYKENKQLLTFRERCFLPLYNKTNSLSFDLCVRHTKFLESVLHRREYCNNMSITL